MFAYCGNNPINRIDPTGQFWSGIKNAIYNVLMKIFAPYESADDAAMAFSEEVYSASQYIRHEYGTLIYSLTLNGTTGYGYTNPIVGTPHSTTFSLSTLPNIFTLTALAHTHPNSNFFSKTDKKTAASLGIGIYVVGPDLYLKRYDPSKMAVITVDSIVPKELAKEQRVSLVDAFRISWETHIKTNCDFDCGNMSWPTP